MGHRAVSGPVVPGPGLVRAGDSGPECETRRKEVLGGLDSGLLGLHLRSTLHRELFTLSRTWLTLGGQFPGVSKAPDVRA